MNAAMHSIVMTFFFQAFDIKILDTNDIEVVDVHPRKLVQKIVSLAVDSLMQLSDFILEGLIIIRSPHRSGYLSLQLCQFINRLLGTSWILYLVAFGINHEGSQTDIQTHCVPGFW